MTDFYAFLGQLTGPGLAYGPRAIRRMNWRYDHIVTPIKDELDGAMVLDLGAHDGRWPYALAAAGATVTGLEGRGNLIAQFARYPHAEWTSRVSFIEGDFLDEMDRLLAEQRHYDIITCLGVFYHTIHHYRMLMQMTAFKPSVIVIDGLFHCAPRPMIALRTEPSDLDRATMAHREGQTNTPIGIVSRPGLELMAESLGYSVEWNDWTIPEDQRDGVADYFPREKQNLQRFTCFLRPA